MTDRNQPTDGHEPFPGQTVLGTAALLLGAALLFLAVVDRAGGLSFDMPRCWYVNRPLWCFIAVTFLTVGGFLLRQRSHTSDSWKPSRSGIRFQQLVFYTREGCHLCDFAKDTLLKYARYLPQIEEVDVDSDPQLVERFGTCVPVVEIDGKVRFRGQVDEGLLRRLIEGTRPRGSLMSDG